MLQRLKKIFKVPSQPSSTRLITTLGIASLLSGFAIVGIYELTLSTIASHKVEATRQAVHNVLPGITQFQPLVYDAGQLQSASEVQSEAELIYAGYDSAGKLVGYAIPGEGPGYQDTIQLLYGYRPSEGLIVGMEVLASRETPGSGDKIQKDEEFLANFKSLAVDPKIVVVSNGSKSQPNEIDGISGATVSTNSVVAILNTSHRRWAERLPASGSESLLPSNVN
jgi:electron transport complex protein RnfG